MAFRDNPKEPLMEGDMEVKNIQILGNPNSHQKKNDGNKINLFDLKTFLNGRKWEDLTKEERLEISGKIASIINESINSTPEVAPENQSANQATENMDGKLKNKAGNFWEKIKPTQEQFNSLGYNNFFLWFMFTFAAIFAIEESVEIDYRYRIWTVITAIVFIIAYSNKHSKDKIDD